MPSAYARRDRKTMWLQRIRSTANPTPQSSFGQLASLMTKTKGEGEQWNVRPSCGAVGTPRTPPSGPFGLAGARGIPTERRYLNASEPFSNSGVGTQNKTKIQKRPVVAGLENGFFSRIAQAICVLKNALTAAEGKNNGALSLTSMSTRAEGRDVFCPSFLINPKGKPK